MYSSNRHELDCRTNSPETVQLWSKNYEAFSFFLDLVHNKIELRPTENIDISLGFTKHAVPHSTTNVPR